MQSRLQHDQVFSQIDDYLTDYVESYDLQDSFNTRFDRWLEHIEEEGKANFYSQERLDYVIEANSDYFSEIGIVDDTGIVVYSSDADLTGTDLKDNDRTAPFLCLLNGETAFSDDISHDPFNDDYTIAYFGRTFRDNSGFVLFGINEQNYRHVLEEKLQHYTEGARIGLAGYFINCGPDRTIDYVTDIKKELQGTLLEDDLLLPGSDGEIINTITDLYGNKCYVGALKTQDYYVLGVYPEAEADQFMLQNNIMFAILFFMILSTFFIAFFVMLDRKVLSQVRKTRNSLKHITDGNLSERVDAGGSLEFRDLSNGINETVNKLKDLIKAEEDRVRTELQNAKNIQESAVPQVFPPFPENMAFGLYASMDTAEAVGGDFYDFFMTDENTLVVVMADVSEKGMPAALFMMRAKTLIKTYAQQGLTVEKVAKETNLRLCENRSAQMFVTAWIGFLDLSTGRLSYVHAGHTLPVLTGTGTSFVKQKINTVLGGIKDAKYLRQEITLSPGDSIFLYTDGVTEAHDREGSMYGSDRLLSLIRSQTPKITVKDRNDYCRAGCEMVLSDLKSFTDTAEQFDDITVMWIKYDGNR